MKMKIKVKVLTDGCMPKISDKGDWIDLMAATNIILHAPQSAKPRETTVDGVKKKYLDTYLKTYYIPLGVAIQLPKGFEAIIASRSSGPNKLGLFIPNGIGIVDNSYCGNDDEWNYVTSPMKHTVINKGDRICQFRIQLSQKATFWQKLKWLFCSGVKLVQVDNLNSKNRGGLGSSGIK